MVVSTLKKPLFVTSIFVALASAIYAGTSMMGKGGLPVVVEMYPPLPNPNTQVTIYVGLTGVTNVDQVVAIGCTDPFAFVDLPSQVVVPAGESFTSFTATTSSSYQGTEYIAATADAVTAVGPSNDL